MSDKGRTFFPEIADMIAETADIDRRLIGQGSLLMEDLELSSIEVYILIGQIEGKYGISIPDNELMAILTAGELANTVARLLEKNPANDKAPYVGKES